MTTIKTSVAKALHTLMLSLMLLSLPKYALADIPTCGNIKISVTTQDSPCGDNGQIKVVADGADIENGNFTNVEFRVYLSDTPPPFIWKKATQEGNQYSYTFIGLEAGIYTVDVRGSCKNNPNPYVEQFGVKKNIVINQSKWEAMNGLCEVMRNTLDLGNNCKINDGAICFKKIKGGQAPYTLNVQLSPVDYNGIKTKKFETLDELNKFILEGLSEGDYTFVIQSSDYCNSYITMDTHIGSYKGLGYDFFYTNLYLAQIRTDVNKDPEYKYNNSVCIRKLIRSDAYNNGAYSGYTVDHYFIRSSKYFEFNYYYEGDSSKSLMGTWQSIADDMYTIIQIDGLMFNLDEIAKDTKNKTLHILVRPKTSCNQTYVYDKAMIIDQPPFRTDISSDKQCGIKNLRIYSNQSSLACYPLSVTIEKRASNSNSYQTVQTFRDSLTYNNSINYISIFKYPLNQSDINYVFRAKLVSFCGQVYYTPDQMIYSSTLDRNAPISIFDTYAVHTGCDNENIYPVVAPLLDLASLRYIKTEKRGVSTNNEWVLADNDIDFVKPTFTEWKKSDLTAEQLKSISWSYKISFWAKSKSQAYMQYLSEENLTKNYNSLSYPKRNDCKYMYYYEFTDTCGFKGTYITTSEYVFRESSLPYVDKFDPYYERTNIEPEFLTNVNCATGEVIVTMPNINDIYLAHQRTNNKLTKLKTYACIIKGPDTSNRMKWIQDKYTINPITITKPGRYYIKYSAQYFNDVNVRCNDGIYAFDVDEKDFKFRVDKSASASYRCSDTKVGDQGYISIKVINGSGGPYLYELFQTNGRDTISLAQKESSDVGEFNNWKSSFKSDEYLVRVTDKGCSTKRSFYQTIQVSQLGIRPMAWADSYNLCVGSTLNLKGLPLGVPDSQYVWTFSGDPNWKMRKQNPSISNVTEAHNGYYKLSVYVPYCSKLFEDSVYVAVNNRPLYWNPAARNGNWYNVDNWLFEDGSPSRTFPSSCTNVHIPGSADHYPNLSTLVSPEIGLFDKAICDTITFHYGSEMSYTTLLKYNYARVQYNFGYYGTNNPVDLSQPANNAESSYPAIGSRPLPVMLRNKWYMLAMPLKKMVSGDFSLAGYPNTFQRLYNDFIPNSGVTPKESYTSPFEKQDFDLSGHNNALSVSVWSYHSQMPGASDHKILESMKGVIELPHILDKRKESFYPLHTYSVLDSVSRFNYYDYETLEPLANSTKKIYRGYDASRFVYENSLNVPNKKIEGDEEVSIYQMPIKNSTHGRKIMIGNPLMSSINFDKLYEANKDVIKNYYQITEASTGDTLTYTVGSGNDNPLRFIPPLQAFIVERINPVNNDKINFYLSGTKSIMRYDDDLKPKPRSLHNSSQNAGWALMSVTTLDKVTHRPTTKTQRLLINKQNTPNIQATISTGNLENEAYFFIMDDQGRWFTDLNDSPTTKVKRYYLGIVSLNKEVINLKLSPGGKDIKKVELVDNYLNKCIDVTDGFDYKFYHRTQVYSGMEGADMMRFQLIITFK